MLRFCFGFGCCLLFAFGWCFAAYGLIDGVVVLYFGVGLVVVFGALLGWCCWVVFFSCCFTLIVLVLAYLHGFFVVLLWFCWICDLVFGC